MAIRTKLLNEAGEPVILARYELIDRINRLNTNNPIRDKAMAAFLYLTGARVEEVCRYVIEKRKREYAEDITERKLAGEPIRKKQIEVREDEGCIIVQNVRTLKRKKHVPRSIPIILTEKEQKIVNIFMQYYARLDEEDALFDLSRQRIYIILGHANLHPHYLRHLRNSHLAIDYGFNSADIRAYNGWSSSLTADRYVHLNVDDLIKKMKSR